MENLLGDILATLRFKSVVYFKYGFCSPWGMEVPKGVYAQFHLVTSGNCLLQIGVETINLEKGDIVIFPNGSAHQIKDQQESVCRRGEEIVYEISKGSAPFDGVLKKTHLICGHYELDRELSHPVFEKLPPYIIIKSSEYGRFDLIFSGFELLVEEMTLQRAGFETVSLRLAEILFISIIRHYYLRATDTSLQLFKDEAIYNIVDLIHKELASDWTIEKLAHKSGMSRTLFIERFKKAVGTPPMKYIANWRLTKAKFFLKNTKLPLQQIGEKIGYHSESSFHRAFKQKYAVSPGRFRLKE